MAYNYGRQASSIAFSRRRPSANSSSSAGAVTARRRPYCRLSGPTAKWASPYAATPRRLASASACVPVSPSGRTSQRLRHSELPKSVYPYKFPRQWRSFGPPFTTGCNQRLRCAGHEGGPSALPAVPTAIGAGSARCPAAYRHRPEGRGYRPCAASAAVPSTG